MDQSPAAGPCVAGRGTSPAGARAVRATDVALDEDQLRLRRTLECLTGIAFTEGNELTMLRNGDRIFPAMLASIRAARRSVDLMTFAYRKGDIAREFAHACAAAAERAVGAGCGRARHPPDRPVAVVTP